MNMQRSKTIGTRLLGLALGAVLGGGVAHAADVGIDPLRFFLVYQVKNASAPVHQLLPQTTGESPFNTKDTPFLIPCAVQDFGGQLDVVSGGPDDADPQVTVELFRADGTIITSHGFSGTMTFDHLTMNLSTVPANTRTAAGFTVVSTINPFKDGLYRPKDLPRHKSVRMRLTVTQSGLVDGNPTNDVVEVWIKRAC